MKKIIALICCLQLQTYAAEAGAAETEESLYLSTDRLVEFIASFDKVQSYDVILKKNDPFFINFAQGVAMQARAILNKGRKSKLSSSACQETAKKVIATCVAHRLYRQGAIDVACRQRIVKDIRSAIRVSSESLTPVREHLHRQINPRTIPEKRWETIQQAREQALIATREDDLQRAAIIEATVELYKRGARQ